MTFFSLPSLKYRILFLILPVSYLLFAFQLLHAGSGFYMSGHDPVYPYLMNALNLASGHMEVGIFEHPGTPLEIFGAVIIRIRHLFCSDGLSITEDVIRHSEAYLYTLAYSLITLLALVCFLTGNFVYRKTGKLIPAILLQLVPAVSPDMIEHALLLKPEAFIILINIFLAAFLYVKAFESKEENPWGTKTILLTGMLMGVLIASKIICAPFVMIVLLLLKDVRKMILFSSSAAISFFLCIIPILSKYQLVIHWIKDLWKHDGHYGQGQDRVLDPHLFFYNLKVMALSNPPFTIACLVLTAAVVSILFRKVYRKEPFGSGARFLVGAWISFSVLIFFVAKHFSYHYLICAQTFIPAVLLGSVSLLSPFIQVGFIKRYSKALGLMLAFSFLVFTCGRQWYGLRFYKQVQTAMQGTEKFIATQEHIPFITISEDHSCFVEPSVWFGIMYTGALRDSYFTLARAAYPLWNYYLPASKNLFHWDEEVFAADLFRKYPRVMVYFIDRYPEEEKKVMDELCTSPDGVMMGAYHKVWSETFMTEDVFIIDVAADKVPKEQAPRLLITSDLEILSAGGKEFSSSDGLFHFQKGELVNHQEFHSGHNSVRLDAQHQFGLDLNFEVRPGDYVETSVWRKSGDENGAMVLTAKDASRFYGACSSVTKTEANGWSLIKCRVRIPDDYPEKLIYFYLYYTGKKEVYFDDIQIKVIPSNS
ncbi:MAG: hypothetical protein ACHQRM_02160 [Bacteroidia bacterium]